MTRKSLKVQIGGVENEYMMESLKSLILNYEQFEIQKHIINNEKQPYILSLIIFKFWCESGLAAKLGDDRALNQRIENKQGGRCVLVKWRMKYS